jgi:hypothetical protein
MKCSVLLSKFYRISSMNVSKLVNAPNVYNFMKILSPFLELLRVYRWTDVRIIRSFLQFFVENASKMVLLHLQAQISELLLCQMQWHS